MFRRAVITDEISQDFKVALDMAVKYGLDGVEIRSVNEHGTFELTDGDIRSMKELLGGTGLTVCCIASPFYKCELDSAKERAAHLEGLKRTIEVADALGTDLIRGFAFWNRGEFEKRIDDIAAEFQQPVELLRAAGKTLVLESESSVYTNNAARLKEVLNAIDADCVKALWDPGNDISDPSGEIPYPDGYNIIKPYMAHMHLKDATRKNGKTESVPVGRGDVDFVGHFRRLLDDGYDGWVSLETHYRPAHSLPKNIVEMPKGSAFSYLGEEATGESLALWNEMMDKIKEAN